MLTLSRSEALEILEDIKEDALTATCILESAPVLLEKIKPQLQPSSADSLTAAITQAADALSNLQTVVCNCARDI